MAARTLDSLTSQSALADRAGEGTEDQHVAIQSELGKACGWPQIWMSMLLHHNPHAPRITALELGVQEAAQTRFELLASERCTADGGQQIVTA